MTTAGIMEVRESGGRVFIYGTHDSYPDRWPALAIKYIADNRGKPLSEVVRGVLRVLREWDYEIHKKTADLYNYHGWKETEREVRRIVMMDFRQISESDIPRNIEKGWNFWYVIDLDRGAVTVRRIKPKVCIDYDYETDLGGEYVCGEEEVTEFQGSLEEYLSKYPPDSGSSSTQNLICEPAKITKT